ncbi:MAG: hypothetical protein ACTSX8_03585 [Alphaproteobacteria bacterium]
MADWIDDVERVPNDSSRIRDPQSVDAAVLYEMREQVRTIGMSAHFQAIESRLRLGDPEFEDYLPLTTRASGEAHLFWCFQGPSKPAENSLCRRARLGDTYGAPPITPANEFCVWCLDELVRK